MWWRLYCASYFVAGKIEGLLARFLVDCGCTTNLIENTCSIDYLRCSRLLCRKPIVADARWMGPIYDSTGRSRQKGEWGSCLLQDKFVVSRIRDDVILGIPFLVAHGCLIRVGSPTIELEGVQLACMDCLPLQSGVQYVIHTTMLPPGAERFLRCRLAAESFLTHGLVESVSPQLLVASSLN